MQENQAPFSEYQPIVRTGPSNMFVKQGKVYTAHACYQCPVCKKWSVTLKEFPISLPFEFNCECGLLAHVNHRGGYAALFAPIETRKVEIAEEILNFSKITEEVPDRALKPETVNN